MASNPPDPGTPQNRASHRDNTAVLSTFPIIQQTPSSRVARNLETLTLTYPSPTDPSSRFPAHSESFHRLSNPPTTADDQAWQQRNLDEARRLMNQFGPDGVRGRMDSGLGRGVAGWDGMPNSHPPHLPQNAHPSPRPEFVHLDGLNFPAYRQSSSTDNSFGGGISGLPYASSSGSGFPNLSQYQPIPSALLSAVPAPASVLPPKSTVGFLPPQHRNFAGSIRLAPTAPETAAQFMRNFEAEVNAKRLADAAKAKQEERRQSVAHAKPAQTTQARPSESRGSSEDVFGGQGQSISPLKRKLSSHHERVSTASPPRNIRKSISVGSGLGVKTDGQDEFKKPSINRSQSGSTVTHSSSRLVAYVEVTPPKLMLKFKNTTNGIAPTKSNGDIFKSPPQSDDDDDDEGSPRRDVGSGSRTSRLMSGGGGRKGDKEQRDSNRRLREIVDNIIESEECLRGDFSLSDLSGTYFARVSFRDSGVPLLSLPTLQKLSAYTLRAGVGYTKGPLRSLTSFPSGSDKGKGKEPTTVEPQRLAEWPVEDLERILKLLERSVADGIDVEVFASDGYSRKSASDGAGRLVGSRQGRKGSKPPRKKQRSAGSVTASDQDKESDHPTETDLDDGTAEPEAGADAEDVGGGFNDGQGISTAKFSESLRRMVEGVLAAEVYLGILSADYLSRELYSEDSLASCLDMVAAGTKVLLTFSEALSDPLVISSSHLARLTSQMDSDSSAHRKSLEAIFGATLAAFLRIEALVSQTTFGLSENLVNRSIYLANQPLFTTDSLGDRNSKGLKEKLLTEALGSKGGFKSWRMNALMLVKALFARYPSQREWIIEEILTSFAKVSDVKRSQSQYRLRDGHVIHSISSLILQLVQTGAHGTVSAVREIRQSIQTESNEDVPEESTALSKESLVYKEKVEKSLKTAMFVARYLFQKSTSASSGKGSKSSTEMEYKAIFDIFISDCLTVLYSPEWPAAAVVLKAATMIFTHALDATKAGGEQTSIKLLAIEHLGSVASKLRSFMVERGLEIEPEDSLPEIMARCDEAALTRVLDLHRAVISYLTNTGRKDMLCESAIQLHVAQLGQELCRALDNSESATPQNSPRKVTNRNRMEIDTADTDMRRVMGTAMEKHLLNITVTDLGDTLFDIENTAQTSLADAASIQIAMSQGLQRAFHSHIVNGIIAALNSPTVGIRTKAIRALGSIVTADATLLAKDDIREIFEQRLSDSSAAVREVALEHLGKYALSSSERADQLWEKIIERIADTGLGVRKRVIKIIRAMYPITTTAVSKIGICRMLVRLNLDDDDGLRDLAPIAIAELWFAPKDVNRTPQKSSRPGDADAQELELIARIIKGVAAYTDKTSDALNNVIRDIASEGSDGKKQRFRAIFDTLVDSLIDSVDRLQVDTFNTIRAIQVISTAMPSIVEVTKAQALLPYLESPETKAEKVLAEMLLKVFRLSLPFMPKTSSAFAADLIRILRPMLNRSLSPSAVPETVACLCAVVKHISQEYMIVITPLLSAQLNLQKALNHYKIHGSIENPGLIHGMLRLASLLVANCDLDTIKNDRSDVAKAVSSFTEGPVSEHFYNLLLQFCKIPITDVLQKTVLPGLSVLFQAYPTLMTRSSSTNMMDEIFDSEDTQARKAVLRLIRDFLVAESEKRGHEEVAKAERANTAQGALKRPVVDITTLVGNATEFADSGVSSAIVQRYHEKILAAALTRRQESQELAIDIVSFTILQGLAHPMQCLPAVISLETSPDLRVSKRALELHSTLHLKHSSVINTRFLESARVAYEYQRELFDEAPRGYRKEGEYLALLNSWYLLVKEKRPRNDFLKAFCKSFEFDTQPAGVPRDTLLFNRFLADNLALLDYKTLEEVLLVISGLTKFLSVSALQINDRLRQADIQGDDETRIGSAVMVVRGQDGDGDFIMEDGQMVNKLIESLSTPESFMNGALTIGLALILKTHLKTLYGLNEEKCIAFESGKKGINDKPAVKRAGARQSVIDLSALPGIDEGIKTFAQWQTQRMKLVDLIDQDGTLLEPEEE